MHAPLTHEIQTYILDYSHPQYFRLSLRLFTSYCWFLCNLVVLSRNVMRCHDVGYYTLFAAHYLKENEFERLCD